MRLRNLTAEHGGLITIFIALTSALLLNTGSLRAEERSPTSAEPALRWRGPWCSIRRGIQLVSDPGTRRKAVRGGSGHAVHSRE